MATEPGRDLGAEVRALTPQDRTAALLWLASSTKHRAALEAALAALAAPEGGQE